MWFAFFMIAFGVATLLYPIIGNYLANRERSEATSVYQEEMALMNEKARASQLELATQYNQELFERQEGLPTTQEVAYKSLLAGHSVMGTLEVPALNIQSLPFYHGTSYATLDKGLGHFESSSIPIGGENTRSVITGHSGMKNQVLFTEIRNLEEGDLFFITILGEKLAYEIDSFEEVLPSEIERVAIKAGKDIVTLLTCTPPGINTYRLLVNGHRIPYEQAIQKKVVRRNLWSYQTIVLVSLASCVIVFILLWLIYRYLLKHSQSEVPQISVKAKERIRYLIYAIRGLFIVLLMTMLVVLGIALYGYTQMQEETDFGRINIGENNDLYAYNADKILQANYDDHQIRSVNVANYADALASFQQNVNEWGIGKLVVAEVNIDLPILSGLSNANLLNGVATYHQNQVLGKGNYVLMAHNLVGAEVLLNRANEIEVGKELLATDFNQLYRFKVTRNEVINERDVAVLESTETPTLTLIRCEGGIGTDRRRLVQGELVQTAQLAESNSTELESLGLEKSTGASDGTLIDVNPISYGTQFGMNLAATILADPAQTIVPLFLLLLFPVIVLGWIR